MNVIVITNRILAVTLYLLVCSTPANSETPDLAPQYVCKTAGDRQLVVDIDYPEAHAASDMKTAIVFFSGGGFRSGGTKQFETQATVYAGAGMVAIRAEYRDTKVDKIQVDTCVEDAISAMRWVRENAKRLGLDPDRIVAAEGSAGGFLAASTWTTEGFHAESDDVAISPKPNALILFNPAVDLTSYAERQKLGPGDLVGKAQKDLSKLEHPDGHSPHGHPDWHGRPATLPDRNLPR